MFLILINQMNPLIPKFYFSQNFNSFNIIAFVIAFSGSDFRLFEYHPNKKFNNFPFWKHIILYHKHSFSKAEKHYLAKWQNYTNRTVIERHMIKILANLILRHFKTFIFAIELYKLFLRKIVYVYVKSL